MLTQPNHLDRQAMATTDTRIASIFTRTVCSISRVSVTDSVVFHSKLFAFLTAATQSPPKCGVLGNMKRKSMRFSLHREVIVFRAEAEYRDFLSSGSSFRAPTKLVGL